MKILANPDRNVAASRYVTYFQQMIDLCKSAAQMCIQKHPKTSAGNMEWMFNQYNIFKNESKMGNLDAIKLRKSSDKSICENSVGYCSTCEQLWKFCAGNSI